MGPAREHDDDVRIASVTVTVVLTDGAVDTLDIPDGAVTDLLSTTLNTWVGRDGLATMVCTITAAMHAPNRSAYSLHRTQPDGRVMAMDVAPEVQDL